MNPVKLIPSLLGFFAAEIASAQPFTYLDASTGPTGNTTLASGSVFSPPTNGTTGRDNNWEERTGLANGGNVLEAAGEYMTKNGENAPEIRTRIAGLTPGGTYRVNVHFWDGGTTNAWSIRAGFASNPDANTHYVAAGDLVAFPNATEGVRAASLIYTAAPGIFVEADRTAYAASVGTAVADGSGQIFVYIDDSPNLTGDPATRTWYDGVSYALIAPPPRAPQPVPETVPEPVAKPVPNETPAPASATPTPGKEGGTSGAPTFRRRAHR